MIQVIKRNEGHKSEVSAIDRGKPQISYNSDGHIVVRVKHDADRDTLIVLDSTTSQVLLNFVRTITQQPHHQFF